MSKEFSNLDDLFKHLQKSVTDSMKKEVLEAVQDEMVKQIETEVYQKYEPTLYNRQREDGGLQDRDNIKGEMVDDSTLEVRNTRRDGNKDVASIVEYGVGYDWKDSNIYDMQPFPRPFHEKTAEALEKNNNHVDALKKGLKRQGIDVE